MDNFRKPKRVNNTSNIDGMLKGRMRRRTLGQPVENSTKSAREGAKLHSDVDFKPINSKRRIGDFSRPEGFNARQSASVNEPKQENKPDGRALGRNMSYKKHKPIDMELDDKSLKTNKSKRKLSGRKSYKKLVLRSLVALFLVGVFIGGYLGVKGLIRARSIFKGGGEAVAWNCQPDPMQLKREGDGRVNVLILGKGGPEQTDGPDLTDTIIVASVDPCNKEAGLLSIPRDLAVKTSSGSYSKINAIYSYAKEYAQSRGKNDEESEKAGIEAIEKSIEEVTGLNINYYAMIDFVAFEKAIDTVGGVDIDVKEPVDENMLLHGKPYKLRVSPGREHFDGLRALAYTRCRHCDNKNDFGRSERQREVIIGLKSKIVTLGTFGNPVKLSQLMDSFDGRVKTNVGMPDEALKLYSIFKDIDDNNIKSISLVDEPNVLIASDGGRLGIGSALIPREGLGEYTKIHNFISSNFIDSFIKKENAGIIVLNGTSTAGKAKITSETLKNFGYNVVETGDAPEKNNQPTVIIDLKKRDTRFTRRYLELRFNTDASTDLPEGIIPPENADFVIIVGRNETSN